MTDLGVATSIAKNNQFSWQDTIDFTLSLKLNSIQFYLPHNKILPEISNIYKFKNIYLHLPNDYDSGLNELISISSEYKKSYKSDKILFHQKESLSNERTLDIIKKFNHQGLVVGIENDGGKELYSYYELIEFFTMNKVKFFAVLDIHRFYHDYYEKHETEMILEMIFKLFNLYSQNKIKIVLHIIDSKSFSSDRNMWVPLLNGIVPYPDIFNLISKKQIDIESIIFEYESKKSVSSSLKNLKKYFSIMNKDLPVK